MTSAGNDQAMYELNLTGAEWEAWAEGADIDDILAARPRPSLAARGRGVLQRRTGGRAMTEATAATEPATMAQSPVLGPAAPTYGDLIWATGNSAATLDDPHATSADRLAPLEAEAAAYEAAKHIGVDDPEPDAYARELELAGMEPEAEL